LYDLYVLPVIPYLILHPGIVPSLSPSFRASEAQLVPDHDPGTRNPVLLWRACPPVFVAEFIKFCIPYGVYPELDSGLGILSACVFGWFISTWLGQH